MISGLGGVARRVGGVARGVGASAVCSSDDEVVGGEHTPLRLQHSEAFSIHSSNSLSRDHAAW